MPSQTRSQTRTRITIHTRQRILVQALPDSFRTWCEHCCDVVVALTPKCLSAALRLTSVSLEEMMQSGRVHAVEAGAGSALICGNSLSSHTTENEILIEGERQ